MPDDFTHDVFLSHSSKDKAVVRALEPVENIQHSTFNIQPRMSEGAEFRAFSGCSALDVGCWMFPAVHGKRDGVKCRSLHFIGGKQLSNALSYAP